MARLFPLLLSLVTMSISFAWVHHIQRRNVLLTPRRWSRLAASRTLQDAVLPQEKSPQFLFVGGKGGVGKTTTSSAIALALSDRGQRTLVVSTDPAHSLGDALDTPLRPGLVTPIQSEQNLWALEIDVEHSLQKFKQSVQGFDAEAIAQSLGVPREMVDSFGLSDVASVFSNPPPGIDEIIGLTQIFRYAELSLSSSSSSHGAQSFDRIVVDTAPTGHTLRLLQLPDFLNSFTGKLIKFRAKIQSAVSSLKALFGGRQQASGAELQQILQSLERLQQDVAAIRSILKDNEQTQFIVVTIPTLLAVEESKRLLRSLEQESIGVSSIVCNQVIDLSADHKYLETRSKGQQASLRSLQTFIDCAVNPQRTQPMEVSLVPYVDTEVTGVHGLRYFHTVAHKPESGTATDPLDARPLTIFSGKGGVGKTTSAASWAMRLCDSGFKTLVVSCDPAHSLGDALQENLSGTPRLIADAASGSGQLWAMEIDPSLAVEEFQAMMKSQISPAQQQPQLLPNIQQEMGEVLGAVNDPPPGIDEIVALSKVLALLEEGHRTADGQHVQFDKIVLDTAPTGHTLRMLDMPKFMKVMLRKLRHIREKTDSMSSLMNMFGGGGAPQSSPRGVDHLASFEAKFDRVDHILHDEYESEFVVVTIPSELAVAETKRLLTKLSETKVPHRRVIVNQVLPSDQEDPAAATAFLNKLRKGQAESIEKLQTISANSAVPLIQVPYFDAETRTVYGLRSISNIIFNDASKKVEDA